MVELDDFDLFTMIVVEYYGQESVCQSACGGPARSVHRIADQPCTCKRTCTTAP